MQVPEGSRKIPGRFPEERPSGKPFRTPCAWGPNRRRLGLNPGSLISKICLRVFKKFPMVLGSACVPDDSPEEKRGEGI